jgi:hypothetical protein
MSVDREAKEIIGITVDVLSNIVNEDEIIDFIKESELNTSTTVNSNAFNGVLGAEFIKYIYDDKNPISLTLKSHLFLENFLDEIIRKKFKKPEILFKRREITFSVKIDLLYAGNHLTEDLYNDITRVNSLRNKFAHNLHCDIADYDITRFKFMEDIKKIRAIKVETKRAVNTYYLRLAYHYLILRLTNKYQFLTDLRF